MACQSAIRGGFLRTMHVGALPRPTGVINLQNQLRRISLATNSGLVRPHTLALSSAPWVSRSNSFATTSPAANKFEAREGKSNPDKVEKTKKTKEPKKDKATKKKPLTEAQKEEKKDQERKAQIAQLKKTALKPPKKLPFSFYALAFREKFHELKDVVYSEPRGAFKAATAALKSLSVEDEERLRAEAKKNHAANVSAYKSWLQSHTPLQIKEANAARRTLSRLDKKNYPLLKDDRLVKFPGSVYTLYLKECLSGSEYQGKPKAEAFKDAAKKWNLLAESEKKRYYELYSEELARYEKEYEGVYGVPNFSRTRAQAQS